MKDTPRGFCHSPSQEQIEEYRRWPIERRLEWLLAGNKMRRELPDEIREIQDRFRRGEI